MKTWIQLLCVGVLAILFTGSIQAAVFVGSSKDITDFVNGSEVSNRGTLVDAINLLNDDNPAPDTTINGVLFKGITPGQLHENGESFAEASFVYNYHGQSYEDTGLWTSGGAYDTLADSQIYDLDRFDESGTDGYGVVNLSPGVLYELQVFMLDDRSGVNKPNMTFEVSQVAWDGIDNHMVSGVTPVGIGYFEGISIGGNGTTQANGEIVTAYFIIDSGFNGVTVNSWNDGAFNGMQLRTVSLPGDLDHDNDVDGRDFLEWQRGYGNPYTAADLADFQAFYGVDLNAPLAANLSAVPEPSTVLFSVLAMGMAAFRRRGLSSLRA